MTKLLIWPENESRFLLINLGLVVFFFISLVALTVGKQQAWYGRYSSKAYGPTVSGRIDWFGHGLANAAFLYILFTGGADPACLSSPANLILIALFNGHYINRSFIHAVRVRDPKPIPVVVLAMTSGFCAVNGYLHARWLLHMHAYDRYWYRSPQFIIGVSMFVFGMYTNIRADTILMNLRKPGEKGYKIPKGFLFEYISGANFFGEIVEWLGFAIAAGSIPGWMFAFATAANIGPRALSHHQWYLQKFENYPPSRKALIPFII